LRMIILRAERWSWTVGLGFRFVLKSLLATTLSDYK
jgi:hypothetical protein